MVLRYFFILNNLSSELPEALINVTNSKVQYAESRQRRFTWMYGKLYDSSESNISVKIYYCIVSDAAPCQTKVVMNKTFFVTLEGLKPNTTYNYTATIKDETYGRTSLASKGLFTTHVIGIV